MKLDRLILLKRIILFIITSISIFSCTSGTFHFYSKDKKKSITIITQGDIRYIASGYFTTVPDSNFVKIDLSNVDRHDGDQIVGCWNQNGLDWIITMDDVKIVENKLDQTRYKFNESFPKNENGIPTLADYGGIDCFSISLDYRDLTRVVGAITQ